MRAVLVAAAALWGGCALEMDKESEVTQESTAPYVGCYVDTPAWDEYSRDLCITLGRSTSVVSFKLFTPTMPSYVSWYITDPFGNPVGASCSLNECSAPISPGQVIYGNAAYYIVNGTPTQGAFAIAHYEFDF